MFQHINDRIKHAVEWYCNKAADNYVWSALPPQHDKH